MKDITFSCLSCGQHIACDESGRGQRVNCPTCDSVIAIPMNGTPPTLLESLTAVPQGRSDGPHLDMELELMKSVKGLAMGNLR